MAECVSVQRGIRRADGECAREVREVECVSCERTVTLTLCPVRPCCGPRGRRSPAPLICASTGDDSCCCLPPPQAPALLVLQAHLLVH